MLKKIIPILLCLMTAASAQTYEPAVSMASFLRMKPQLNNAEPSIADNELDLLFAPQGDFEATVLYRVGDQVVQELKAEPRQRFGSMARLKWKRTTVPLGTESGPRSIEVMLDGKSVGLLEFTLTKSGGDDPFNPKPTWRLAGPWSDLAYFTFPNDDGKQQRINFHYWSNKGDLGGTKGMIDVAMKRDGKVLAQTKAAEASYDFYLHRDKPLLKPNDQPVMVSDLKALEGPFVMELSHQGRVVKRFRGQISNGELMPHPRSALDYQPRNRFLSPRTVGEKGGGLDPDVHVWLTRESLDPAGY